jgi:hypothetical protein
MGTVAAVPGADNATTVNTPCCRVDEPTARRLLGRPARSLTLDEAYYAIVYLVQQGSITLRDRRGAVSPQFTPGCAAIRHPDTGAHVLVIASTIDGVVFENVNGHAGFIDNCDPRIAVLLYHFAYTFRVHWGVTEIRHEGIGHGRGSPLDCHHTGRAFDFSGLVGTYQGHAYQRLVRDDWGNRPIPENRLDMLPPAARHRPVRPANRWPVWTDGGYMQIPANGAVATRRLQEVEGAAHPPLHRFDSPRYRLDPGGGQGTEPEPFTAFREVYKLATFHASQEDGSLYDPAPVSLHTPARDGYVVHPDHMGSRLNQTHYNHVHMQIGPTFDPAPSTRDYAARMAQIYRRSSAPVGPIQPCAGARPRSG